jgi:ABC-type multidrug transport system fused ATPase/permease subunit
MFMGSLHSFYGDRIDAYTEQLRMIRQKASLTASFRLIVFAGFAIAVYFFFEKHDYFILGAALLLLAGYIVLVNRSQQLKNRMALLEKLLFINTNELQVLKHGSNGFPDGQGFLKDESYLDDLDIFGKGSLFHLLNRTTSSYGAESLATALKQPLLRAEDIKEQQQAIRVLTGQVEKRQSIMAYGLLNGEEAGKMHSLMSWLGNVVGLFLKKWVMIALWGIVAYNCASLLFWAIAGDYRPLIPGILVSWMLNGLYARSFLQGHDIAKKQAVLEQYATTLRLFNSMDKEGSVMLERLQTLTTKAHQSIRRLAKLSDYLDRQSNPMVGIVLNSLFVYNLRGQVALERWKQANKRELPEWIDAVGRIECLNSLATFAFNNPDYCYPSPQPDRLPLLNGSPHAEGSPQPNGSSHPDGSLSIEARQLAHPLLPAAGTVTNDLSIGKDDRIMLVTGSNMSGKTTFLRTVGVNLLLAQCGAPVCATSFSFTPMQILSSLRISDSLQENTSYFMAELKKLQWIVHSLQSGRQALVLIDEILRGTNSEDKTHGSEQFIRKLLRYPCLSLFATHDLTLGKLEEECPGLISNYCFESIIEKEELHFDYRLQRGIARNRNASFLMKKMEII